MKTRRHLGVAIAKADGQTRRVNSGACPARSRPTPDTVHTPTRTRRGLKRACLDDAPFRKHAWAPECGDGDVGRAGRSAATDRSGRPAGDCRTKSRLSSTPHGVKKPSHGRACSRPDRPEALAYFRRACAAHLERGGRRLRGRAGL